MSTDRCAHGNLTLQGAPVCVECEVEQSGLRELLVRLTDEQRVKLFEEVEKGYCAVCGESTDGRICYCQNDE
jgi:hypothetical protein